MNLLNRLCEEEYLDENYDSASHEGGSGCCSGDSGCGSNKKSSACGKGFSIAELISAILRNVFLSVNLVNNAPYLAYSQSCEQKFT